MGCREAQEVISAALDREPVDAAVLADAKAHSRRCPDCAAFVRTMLAVKRSPLPEAPADLAERSIAAVRMEAARQAEPETAAVAPASPRPHRLLPPRLGAPSLAWVAAAAVFLVVAGVIGLDGIRQISSSQSRSATGTAAMSSEKGSARDSATPPQANTGTSGGPVTEAASAPNAVTFDGVVYRSAGQATTGTGSLQQIGSANTALGEGGAPAARKVLGGSDASRIYIGDMTGTLQAFDRVTRDYGGLTYALTSAEITAFGQWASLPASIPAPANPDGSPTFTAVGTDGSGVRVYRLSSADITRGIAIAPGSPITDPAVGNPNWTWWQPVR